MENRTISTHANWDKTSWRHKVRFLSMHIFFTGSADIEITELRLPAIKPKSPGILLTTAVLLINWKTEQSPLMQIETSWYTVTQIPFNAHFLHWTNLVHYHHTLPVRMKYLSQFVHYWNLKQWIEWSFVNFICEANSTVKARCRHYYNMLSTLCAWR